MICKLSCCRPPGPTPLDDCSKLIIALPVDVGQRLDMLIDAPARQKIPPAGAQAKETAQ